MPRPTKMTPATVGKLREAFMLGCTDLEACVYAQISRDTLYAYQQQHPQFSNQKARLKAMPHFRAKVLIVDAIHAGDLRAAMWYLERNKPDEFNKRRRRRVQQHSPALNGLFGATMPQASH